MARSMWLVQVHRIADGVGDIGDNADSSNKKAQKLKKTLLSIDEIHALVKTTTNNFSKVLELPLV